MSGYISGAVWNTRFPEKVCKFVLASIADNANDEGFAWPSVEAIEARTQYSRRRVLDALEALVDGGWVVKMRSPKSFRHNAYQIVLDKLNFEKPKSPELTLGKRKRQVHSTTRQVQSTTPKSGAIHAESGAIRDKSQVQPATDSGAIDDSLYGRTVKEPSEEPSRGIVSEAPPVAIDQPSAPFIVLARALLSRCLVQDSPPTIVATAEAIRAQGVLLAMTPENAARLIGTQVASALQRGEKVNRFWFEDGKWRLAPASAMSAATVGMALNRADEADDVGQPVIPEGADTDLGGRVWSGMRRALSTGPNAISRQSFDTWIKPLEQRGVLDGVLYLEMPNVEFSEVASRYELEGFLPAAVGQVKLVVAERWAA